MRWTLIVLLTAAGLSASAAPPLSPLVPRSLRPDTESVGLLHTRPYQPLRDREVMLERYTALLKDLPFDYGKVGSGMEGLAYLHLKSIYREPDFFVTGNISYHNAAGDTVGEMDVLVQDRHTGDVILVGEVKVSRHLGKAGHHATAQLKRLADRLARGEVDHLSFAQLPAPDIGPENFRPSTRFIRIGNRGALKAGFDFEADLTREEADLLQARLLAGPTAPVSAAQEVEQGVEQY